MSDNTNNDVSCVNSFGFLFKNACFCFKKNKKTIKMKKCDFISSALTVSLNIEDAWRGLLEYITNLVNSYIVVVITKCDKIHSLTVKLCSIKYCEKNEELILNVIYPIYSKKNKVNNCLCKTKSINPCKQNVTYDYSNNTCSCGDVGSYANLNYDNLKNTCYENVKFYYDNNYSYNPFYVSV